MKRKFIIPNKWNKYTELYKLFNSESSFNNLFSESYVIENVEKVMGEKLLKYLRPTQYKNEYECVLYSRIDNAPIIKYSIAQCGDACNITYLF